MNIQTDYHLLNSGLFIMEDKKNISHKKKLQLKNPFDELLLKKNKSIELTSYPSFTGSVSLFSSSTSSSDLIYAPIPPPKLSVLGDNSPTILNDDESLSKFSNDYRIDKNGNIGLISQGSRSISNETLTTSVSFNSRINNKNNYNNKYAYDYSYYNNGLDQSNPNNNWLKLVKRIFEDAPFVQEDQFLDELKYTIISSKLLSETSLSSSKVKISPVTKSILDFKDNFRSNNKLLNCTNKGVLTKYGCLIVTEKSFLLRRITPSYIKTALFIYSTLKKLLRTANLPNKNVFGERKRIFILLLIINYLNLQQQTFASKFIKYSTLLSLKKSLCYFQNFNDLVSKYLNYYKELVAQQNITNNNINGNNNFFSEREKSNVIKDLNEVHIMLNTCLFSAFHKVFDTIKLFLPLININTFVRYVGVFNIDLLSIYNSYKIYPSNDPILQYKSYVEIMKFFLCTILSISCNNSFEIDQENKKFLSNTPLTHDMLAFLENLFQFVDKENGTFDQTGGFTNSGAGNYNDNSKFNCLKSQLQDISEFYKPFIELMGKRKELLFYRGGTDAINNSNRLSDDGLIEGDRLSAELIDTLSFYLRNIQNRLLSANKLKLNDPKFQTLINKELSNVTDAWNSYIVRDPSNIYKQRNECVYRSNTNSLRASNNKCKGPINGLSLNVVKPSRNTSLLPVKSLGLSTNDNLINIEEPVGENTTTKEVEEQETDDNSLSMHNTTIMTHASKFRASTPEDYHYSPLNPKLTTPIEDIIDVEEGYSSGASLEMAESGNVIKHKSNANTGDPNSVYEKFKQLSDDELRNRLNERIKSFARENRKGKKMQLLSKKSFDLLANNESGTKPTTKHLIKHAKKKKVKIIEKKNIDTNFVENASDRSSEELLYYGLDNQSKLDNHLKFCNGISKPCVSDTGNDIIVESLENITEGISKKMFREENIPFFYELNDILNINKSDKTDKDFDNDY
ncbi:uncharacterized protein SCODWIG_03149 [Saccharomycodes ludwigii]|uniref:Inheritance of peroxisomes protein 2 n=1 Tax=Saccharomycodes ludwigii TaxID=36035 RepID=A0A376B9M5_9ASCO|nr:hypothetical protein SCDLUD_002652 [Saccharomycodes ludwigii]KAH3901169.1 hypothetical protein SCDLUD_002652 [Saccharomycodes ludwigii]SSD61388.1 uncharacterized protein SCODWIG_03149 [Saccharomycodes ludwigii]